MHPDHGDTSEPSVLRPGGPVGSGKATVPDELLAARPDLRELAETRAARFLSTEDRVTVAAHVADTLRGLDIENSTAVPDTTATIELAAGILLGLYRCRDGESETLLEYAPDFAVERAMEVMRRCAKLGIELPNTEVLDLAPEWDAILDR